MAKGETQPSRITGTAKSATTASRLPSTSPALTVAKPCWLSSRIG